MSAVSEMSADPYTSWHPVACSYDLIYRHVFQGQLLGRELAIWRADDGYVNVWENRCLHRGVRLSIGTSDGTELRCQYHGWRYANRSAGCTYIPAHPADAPARTICNRTFPGVERYGLLWSGEEPAGEPPTVDILEVGSPFVLRNLPVNAAPEIVIRHLQNHRFLPSTQVDRDGAPDVGSAHISVQSVSDFAVELRSEAGEAHSDAVFFVQPVDSGRCVIRCVLAETPPPEAQMAVLKHHAFVLNGLVETIEADAKRLPAPEPLVPALQKLSLDLTDIPETPSGRTAGLRVTVSRKWNTAAEIAAFELRPLTGVLPTFQPGAHIDVHLPNGLIRQYSLTNGPGESLAYRIGVKLEAVSTGGSRCLHETVREGDVLAISEPRNNFVLRRDAVHTVLLAGGIGITPLLAMAQSLRKMNLGFDLHYFAQSENHLAFADVLEPMGESVITHLGLSPQQTVQAIQSITAEPKPHTHLYVCGPGPMLDAVRAEAAAAGWSDDTVHFEYFKNTLEVDDSSTFEIALARSALTLRVPAGSTILEVLRDNGVAMPSSCEQGACGTCVVTLLEGEPDHQDVYLNNTDREAGDRIMTCVSRAKSERLVLDL